MSCIWYLNAMRSIVCIAHERANTVHPCNFLLLILYNLSFMTSFIVVNIISNKISERIIMNLIVFFGFLMITKTLYLIPYFKSK